LQQASKKYGDATSNTDSSVLPSPEIHFVRQPCCRFCGRNGLVVDHFPRRGYGNSGSVAFNSHFHPLRGRHDKKNATRQSSNTHH
jgi:hypothetical protein